MSRCGNSPVQQDTPPAIALAKDPTQAQSGALQLSYTMTDDYGVVSASGEITPTSETAAAMRPLVRGAGAALSLPQLRTRDGTGETTRDLTSHPWAGAKVNLTLVARDDAEQEGRSAPFAFTLPRADVLPTRSPRRSSNSAQTLRWMPTRFPRWRSPSTH